MFMDLRKHTMAPLPPGASFRIVEYAGRGANSLSSRCVKGELERAMRWRRTIHFLRFVASFGLLGAILAGIAFGWLDHEMFRVVGALVGVLVGIIIMSVADRSGGERHKQWPA